LAPQGLNLIGAAEVARYDAIVPPRHAVGSRAPDARTLVVIGNGGGAFWEAFRCYREREALAGHQPATLDAFPPPLVMRARRAPGRGRGAPAGGRLPGGGGAAGAVVRAPGRVHRARTPQPARRARTPGVRSLDGVARRAPASLPGRCAAARRRVRPLSEL